MWKKTAANMRQKCKNIGCNPISMDETIDITCRTTNDVKCDKNANYWKIHQKQRDEKREKMHKKRVRACICQKKVVPLRGILPMKG